MSFHLTSLRYQVVEHLIVTNPIDGEKDENSTGDQCSTDFIDEKIVPVSLVFVAANRVLVRRFSNFEIEFVSNGNPHNLECIEDDGATRGSSDIFLSTSNKHGYRVEKDAEWKEICGPEINVSF